MAEWSGAERRGGDGGRPRGGSESPDRRLQPSVGPRRASAPVSGSVGAGCRPPVLPGGQPGWWRAAARAWERGAAGCALFTRCADSPDRPSRRRPAPSSAGRVPLRLRAGGQAEPARTPGPPCGLRASLCCSFTHVCDLGSSLHGQKWVSVIITTPALCPCPVAPGPARSRSSPALWCHLVELRRWLLCSELSTFSMG